MKKCLYEILVPTMKDGKRVSVKFHRGWDAMVRQYSNGLTIHKTSKGQWISSAGILFIEKMIPVKIMCTPAQIKVIADITAEYYNQEAVMYYKISNDVVVKYYK